jgi:F-type H+-transporting ATPase subunit b
MQEIFQQLQGDFIGAVPTALLFIVLVLAYQLLIQGPLTAALKERHARTQGAVEAANKAIEMAEKRSAEYETKLRLARAQIFKAREERIKQWNAEREAALETARKAAGVRVAQAKVDLDTETEQARRVVQSSASELASQVVRAVLPATAGGTR